jgi:hypothetical protein
MKSKTKKYDIFEDIIHWNSINDSCTKVNHYYIVINNNEELEWFCHFLNLKKISGLGRRKDDCDYDTNPKRFETAQGGYNDEFPKRFVLDYNYGYRVSIDEINTGYYYAININLSDTVQYSKFLYDVNNNKEIFNKYHKELTMMKAIADENEKKIMQKQEHQRINGIQDDRERQYEEYQKLIKREEEDEEMFEREKERRRQLKHGISQYEMNLDVVHTNFW